MGPVRPDNDDDERYRPPPPAPVRFGDPINAVALVAVIGSPIVIVLFAVLAGGGLPWPIGALLTLAFVVGFTTLVVRAKPSARIDERPDDGAVL